MSTDPNDKRDLLIFEIKRVPSKQNGRCKRP